ncbi:protein kinase C iota type-like [Paramacrobiotus metropolitanus]|uniref:protein kinase C iota type-like n=1 Tax=Paramacrobiotus metropolitanus TaxID=2943436 RepID=UPI00244657CA|nr:protein kinase C iota type-like [Paramacrobiotus metropolitanus]
MPIFHGNQPADESDMLDIRIKAAYNGDVFITYIQPNISLGGLHDEIRGICRFPADQVFTVKWLDEEGDACTISSQTELDEAVRLFEVNKEQEIVLHIFPSIPERPGMPCPGENKNMYRRGALRRNLKEYHVNGHVFRAKRFNRRAFCAVCSDRVWGLGRQGFKCLNCKLMVHKRCHKQARMPCEIRPNDTESKSLDASFSESNHRSLIITNAHTDSKRASEVSHSLSVRPSSNNILRQKNNAEPIILNGSPQAVDLPGFPKHGEDAAGDTRALSLDDFELIKVIGRGSYAKVLAVELKKTGRPYAMKVIKKELIKEDEDIEWVQTEKHVFETASNYPFLVGLHSCFQTPSRLFFVIELVTGGDLMYHMQRQRKLPEEHAKFYGAEITLALNYLHKKGIIYRDLKLDNVLLDQDGHIKLTDYGMCKEGILTPEDRAETFCGTPNYIAPEILKGQPYTFSVDWWALGVLLYEMMVGKSPFDVNQQGAENPDQQTEDYLFQVILEKTIRIPRTLQIEAANVLKGFLNKIPEDRLGCHPQTGFDDIKHHAFFRKIDFEALEKKQKIPPFKPKVQSALDLHNFDPQFTDEPVRLTPDDPSIIDEIDQSEFEGFEYVNPLLMSAEDPV